MHKSAETVREAKRKRHIAQLLRECCVKLSNQPDREAVDACVRELEAEAATLEMLAAGGTSIGNLLDEDDSANTRGQSRP
jgi:hypothetical protein